MSSKIKLIALIKTKLNKIKLKKKLSIFLKKHC